MAHHVARPQAVLVLQEVHLELGLVLHEVVTGRAIPPRLEWSAAGRVPRSFSGKPMTGPPVREQAKRARKFPAFRGQLVRCARGSLGIRPRYEKRVAFQPLEALRQDVRGDPGDLLQQLVEPSRSREQGLHDEQSPTIPDLRESIGERGGRALVSGGILFAHRQTVSVRD
jgi:hypothetical protein